ncbi:MAG: hypothetical protein HDT00_04625 [Bacteroidales bacterium]|nr:hypothetical protein [Bacteroidales bacterium]
MKNRIHLHSAVDAVFALSALKAVTNDSTLPGPYGRHEEAALLALARNQLLETCAELDLEVDPTDDSVDLPGDHHRLLQAVVTDRLIASLSGRPARTELHRRLRCRLRPRPPRPSGHINSRGILICRIWRPRGNFSGVGCVIK